MPVAPSAPRGAFYTTASQANAAAASNGKAGVPVQVKFQTGKGYYLSQNTTAHPAAASASPSGLMTPTQLLAAATSNVNNTVNPQITALNTQAKQQAGNDQGLINGYTNNAVGQVKAIDFGAPYKAAAQDQNAVNSALLANLQGQGSSIQNQLAGLLGGSVDPSVAGAVGGQVAANTAGAGNANLAKGDASLSQILSQGAAAKTYGNSLPGLELLSGQQDTAKTQGAINQNLATAVGDLRSKVPGLVQAEEASLGSNQTKQLATLQNYALAEIAAGQKQQGEKDLNAYRQAELQLGQNRITAGQQETQARITAGQQAAKTKAAATVAAAQARAAANGNKPASQAQVDSFLKGLKTPNYVNVSKLNPDGSRVSQRVQQGVTYTLSFLQALKRLHAMRIDDATARQELQTIYPRGVQGRAWLTNEEQNALKGAQAKMAGPAGDVTTVHKYQGHAYLTMPQAAVLRQAGLLPQGEQNTVNGVPVWYINPNA